MIIFIEVLVSYEYVLIKFGLYFIVIMQKQTKIRTREGVANKWRSKSVYQSIKPLCMSFSRMIT